MFRYGGIFRDVTLTAVPKTFIRDHYISSTLTKSSEYKSGTLKVEMEVENRSSEAFNGVAEITLQSPDGTKVVASLPQQQIQLAAGKKSTINASVAVSNLDLWTAETPTLYNVVFSLKDANGKETEAFCTKYGFRHINQVGSFIHINGKKVFFKGVNRQDTHPVLGRTQDLDILLKDVLLYKQFNINMVRTSHCPHQAKMMAMYDHFGVYVMDEADLEAHAMDGRLSNDASWSPAFVDRQVRMVRRDRNHPSVIFWSMGNESKNGTNFGDCRNAIDNLDNRMVHYEGQEDYRYSDFTSKMYPYERDVISADYSSDSRPHFYCEYAHAMGQSLGNFQDYWDYIENSRRTIGGCVWDWADQAIYDPKKILAGNYKKGDYSTGYDYPGPHQGNFLSNGIVGPEREVSQKLVEVKKVHQWIKMKDFVADTKTLMVNNTYDFIDLSDFYIQWIVSADGLNVETGMLNDFNVESEASKELTIPYKTVITADTEYLLTVRFLTREKTDWAEAGHCVAEE
jgi:beta-galactosidase